MRSEDLSRRDIKPGLIIYPQPDTFFKDTDHYKFIPIPTPQFPYVCLHVNDEESEWARIIRKDAPNNIRVDRKGVLNPSEGFLWGESFVSYDERFKIPVSNVMSACQNSRVPRPAFSPPVTKKIRESFGYEPKTEGTPLAMAAEKTPAVNSIKETAAKKPRKKGVRELKPVYEKIREFHQIEKLNCKQIASRINSPTVTETKVRAHLRKHGIYDENVDVVKSSKTKNIPVLSPEDEAILEMEAKIAELKQAKILKIKEQAEDELKSLVDKYTKEGLTITYTLM